MSFRKTYVIDVEIPKETEEEAQKFVDDYIPNKYVLGGIKNIFGSIDVTTSVGRAYEVEQENIYECNGCWKDFYNLKEWMEHEQQCPDREENREHANV